MFFPLKNSINMPVLLTCYFSHNKKNDDHTDNKKTDGQGGHLPQKAKSSKPYQYLIVILIIEIDQPIHDNPPLYSTVCFNPTGMHIYRELHLSNVLFSAESDDMDNVSVTYPFISVPYLNRKT